MGSSSVDLILCDLPYEKTQNHWDKMIPLGPLWEQYKRILKPCGVVVLTAIQPFASRLVLSNLEMFRYDWIWRKNRTTGFLNAKKMPLRNHEHVIVFYSKLPKYYPQKTHGHKPVNFFTKHTPDGSNYGKTKLGLSGGGQTDRFPTSIQDFPVVKNDNSGKDKLHPTQKPVAMMEYFIRTYTDEGDLVLDNACGSGTTGVAAQNLGRAYILMDNDPESYEKAKARLGSTFLV